MRTIIPADIPVTRWAAPSWATSSLLEPTLISHNLDVDGLTHDETDPQPLAVSLSQTDGLSVAEDGSPRVVRTDPVVIVDALRLTLTQADALARALVELVEASGAQR